MMTMEKIYILDTSAIFSGKFVNINDALLFTSEGVSKEISPGGRDYNNFHYLIEKGLKIIRPSQKSIQKIIKIIEKTGDVQRLSETDIEILAVALEYKDKNEVIIVTDDYSIQNVANVIKIKFEPINQAGITKRFIWVTRCRGCGKKFKDNISICPMCGSDTKKIVSKKSDIH